MQDRDCKFSPWRGKPEGQVPPNCPDFKKPVRPKKYKTKVFKFQCAQLPWNSNWDKHCYYCRK